MQEKGLTRFIGITGHGMDVPKVFLEALNRYDFDSVLFPINPTLFSDADYRSNSLSLLDLCEKRDVGVMIIKAVAKEPWKSETHSLHTWYRPFEEEEAIQKSINFVLSQKLTHICTPGDYRILPKALKACENFELLSLKEQESLIKERASLENIF